MANATKTKATGFSVTCPHCHDTDSTVTIDLNNVCECRCSGCDETFTPLEARDMIAAELARWDVVCRWVQMVPTMTKPGWTEEVE